MKKYFENPTQAYVAPEIEVTEIVSEGVLCASPASGDWNQGDDLN